MGEVCTSVLFIYASVERQSMMAMISWSLVSGLEVSAVIKN